MVWLIVSQVIAVLALAPWTLFLGGFALSSALNTSSSQSLTYIFWLVVSYPVVLIVSIITAWVVFRQKKLQLANILTSIPMVYVIPSVIALLLNFLT